MRRSAATSERAAKIAADTGLITANNKWVGIDFLTYESVARKISMSVVSIDFIVTVTVSRGDFLGT